MSTTLQSGDLCHSVGQPGRQRSTQDSAVLFTDTFAGLTSGAPAHWENAQISATESHDGHPAVEAVSTGSLVYRRYGTGREEGYVPGRPYWRSWWQKTSGEWSAQASSDRSLYCDATNAYYHVYQAWNPAGAPLYLAEFRARLMTNAEWAAVGDREFSALGCEVRPYTDPTRLALLPKTVAALRDGASFRLVLNGDSWQVDHSRGPVEAYLMRSFPGTNVELRLAARGSTGASQVDPGWDDDSLINGLLVPELPSSGLVLVYLGGISSAYTEAEIPRWAGWIAKVRAAVTAAGCDCEIVIGSEAGGRSDMRAYMQAIATANDCAFFDAGGAMNDFLSDAGLTLGPLLRDGVHLDNPGWHILGRAFASWLGALFP